MSPSVVAFGAEMLPEVAAMLARAFVTNPLHEAAFGPGRLARNEAFFRIGLAAMKGPKYVAMDNGRPAGFVHWVQAPECQFPLSEKVRGLPAMVRGFGVRSTLRVGRWLTEWSRHDPREPHVHLGPIGVDPTAQGSGVGRVLMEAYCRHLDEGASAGYLETDRPRNVAFYRRFGFEVMGEASVLGVTSFFMRRPPRT